MLYSIQISYVSQIVILSFHQEHCFHLFTTLTIKTQY